MISFVHFYLKQSFVDIHKNFLLTLSLCSNITLQVNFIQLDEKGTQTKPAKERRKVTRNSATSTSGHKFPDPTTVKTIKQNSDLTPQITQYIETGSKFVIIDYIASDNQKSGELPLSTSTPRDYQGLTTDTNHNFVPRQRKPHDGSLVEIPASQEKSVQNFDYISYQNLSSYCETFFYF